MSRGMAGSRQGERTQAARVSKRACVTPASGPEADPSLLATDVAIFVIIVSLLSGLPSERSSLSSVLSRPRLGRPWGGPDPVLARSWFSGGFRCPVLVAAPASPPPFWRAWQQGRPPRKASGSGSIRRRRARQPRRSGPSYRRHRRHPPPRCPRLHPRLPRPHLRLLPPRVLWRHRSLHPPRARRTRAIRNGAPASSRPGARRPSARHPRRPCRDRRSPA
jgi:hypothetical protein